MDLNNVKDYKHINAIQCIAAVDEVLYNYDYDEISDYLRGVRDALNMINQLEEPREIAKYIISECKKINVSEWYKTPRM